MLHQDRLVGFKAVIKYWGADHKVNQAIPSPNRWHTFIKIEIITNEIICFEPQARKLLHPYSDSSSIDIDIPCYTVSEIICEKIRAMLQRKYTAPRDYYDTWYLVINESLNWQEISENINKKLAFKNIILTNVDDLFSEKHVKTLTKHWAQSLSHHLSSNQLPEPLEVINFLKMELSKNLKL